MKEICPDSADAGRYMYDIFTLTCIFLHLTSSVLEFIDLLEFVDDYQHKQYRIVWYSEYIKTANYMGIRGFHNIACAKLASLIKGTSLQKLKDTIASQQQLRAAGKKIVPNLMHPTASHA